MHSLEDIRDIFYSGGHAFTGNIEPIQDITFLLNEGYLHVTIEIIAPLRAYRSFLADNSSPDTYDAAGGGPEHVALKHVAAEYLRGQQRMPIFEQSFCGYYPDVMSKDGHVVIECGHTQNPDKILAYLQHERVQKCIQVPYPAEHDADVMGHTFAAGTDLGEFLAALEESRRGDLRNVFRGIRP